MILGVLAALSSRAVGAPVAPWNVLVMGDSNANSTSVDVTYAGQGVPSGWTYRHNGVTYATWPAGNTPGVAALPYFVDAAISAGVGSGWVIRRGTNGGTVVWPGTVQGQWDGAVADATALGGAPSVVVLVYGANDARTLGKAAAYHANMVLLIDRIVAAWPGAEIILWRERCSNGSAPNYPYLRYGQDPSIYAAQDQLVLDYAGIGPTGRGLLLADGTVVPMPDLYDGIHWSTGGHGDGQRDMVVRTWGLLYP